LQIGPFVDADHPEIRSGKCDSFGACIVESLRVFASDAERVLVWRVAEDLFWALVSDVVKHTAELPTRVVFVPSVKGADSIHVFNQFEPVFVVLADAHHFPVFPQPPFSGLASYDHKKATSRDVQPCGRA
jgi:hypothetical protein